MVRLPQTIRDGISSGLIDVAETLVLVVLFGITYLITGDREVAFGITVFFALGSIMADVSERKGA